MSCLLCHISSSPFVYSSIGGRKGLVTNMGLLNGFNGIFVTLPVFDDSLLFVMFLVVTHAHIREGLMVTHAAST